MSFPVFVRNPQSEGADHTIEFPDFPDVSPIPVADLADAGNIANEKIVELKRDQTRTAPMVASKIEDHHRKDEYLAQGMWLSVAGLDLDEQLAVGEAQRFGAGS